MELLKKLFLGIGLTLFEFWILLLFAILWLFCWPSLPLNADEALVEGGSRFPILLLLFVWL